LDEEALRVVNSMPHWKPAKMEGKPVKVEFKLPISFKLQ
jgi:protein TonB